MEYRGYEIRMFESENVRTQKPDGSTFSVRNSGGLVFYARSKFGDSFARDSESARSRVPESRSTTPSVGAEPPILW